MTTYSLAVRSPRMLHWRRHKPASEADTLETLKRMASLNRE